VVCLVTAQVAGAQTAASDIEQVWLDPSGRGSLQVGNGQLLKPLDFRVGVSLFYTRDNLRPRGGTLVSDRIGFQVFGALGITDWLELGANVPVLAYQSGAADLASGGLANPWLHVKVAVLDWHHPVSLAIDLGAGVPVGTGPALGNGGFEFAPKVQLGRVFDAFQVGGELGFLLRGTASYGPGEVVGPQLWLAGMVTGVNTSGPRGEFTLRVVAPLNGGGAGAESLLGLRWPVGDVELFGAAGPGFFGGPSTPSIRAYLGAAFANTPLTRPACVEGTEYVLADCPALDFDHDGILNAADRCPTAPEDKDGFEDQDGCPDPDNDHDGVPDASDKCVDVAGPAANQGCPDTDADGDGVVDRLDKCPAQAEDKDGFEDDDGCPEPDNDHDGIADSKDTCPLEAETINGWQDEDGCPDEHPDVDGDGVPYAQDRCPFEAGDASDGCPHVALPALSLPGFPGLSSSADSPTASPTAKRALAMADFDHDGVPDEADPCPMSAEDKDGFEDEDGCPEPDNDHDGILDAKDKCPLEAETINGVKDDDGCPDVGAGAVTVENGQVVIDRVVGFKPASATLQPTAGPLLQQVAATLRAASTLAVEIQGHTDDTGSAVENIRLSKKRAEAIRAFLIKAGVSANRLKASGFGPTRPRASNKTAEGREKNRRVEFLILGEKR
jgi:outer membrane protein OmpA-like peptidoglycan-associated protein